MVLRYLKGTLNFSFYFKSCSHLDLEEFSNANQASNLDDRKSTSGYCIYLGNNLIQWSTRKQKIVTRSSTKSEYRSLAQASTKIIWLQ